MRAGLVGRPRAKSKGYQPADDRPKSQTFGRLVSDLAEKLRVSRQTLHAILAERQAITPEMALRIGKLCGNGPGIWLRMQQTHDVWRAQRNLTDELAHIPTLSTVDEAF